MDEKLLCIAHTPDQKLQFELLHRAEDGLAFRVLYDGTLVLSSSRLGICFSDHPDDLPADLKDHRTRALPFGGTELFVRLRKAGHEIAIRILVLDDRVAFRYEFPGYDVPKEAVAEKTSFRFALDASMLGGEASQGLLDESLLALPVLFELDNGLYMSVDRVPNDPDPLTLRLTEGRLLSVSEDNNRALLPGIEEVTPWWTVSFTHP